MRRLTQLQRDLAANLGARFWSMLLNLLAVPIYLRHLGAEAYGLIGLMLVLENLSALMDSGLGLTLNREMARRGIRTTGDDPTWRDTRRDFLATLQLAHWALALVCASLVFFGAPLIAQHWVQAKVLDPGMIASCLRWMSLSVAGSVIFSFYQGGLFGAGQQVSVNVVVILFSTLRLGGCMALLTFVTPAPATFFAVQGITLAAQAATSGLLLWHLLPRDGQRARTDLRYIKQVWSFAAVVSGNAFLTAAVSQALNVVLSRTLSLGDFGYYTIAGSVAGTLWAVALPLTAPFFPRFAELWAQGETRRLAEIYHRASQLVTVAVAPLAVILATFANHLLMI